MIEREKWQVPISWDWIGEIEREEGEDWIVCVKNERDGGWVVCVWNEGGDLNREWEKKSTTVQKKLLTHLTGQYMHHWHITRLFFFWLGPSLSRRINRVRCDVLRFQAYHTWTRHCPCGTHLNRGLKRKRVLRVYCGK